MGKKDTKTEAWQPEPGSTLSNIFGALVSEEKNLADKRRIAQAIRRKHA